MRPADGVHRALVGLHLSPSVRGTEGKQFRKTDGPAYEKGTEEYRKTNKCIAVHRYDVDASCI